MLEDILLNNHTILINLEIKHQGHYSGTWYCQFNNIKNIAIVVVAAVVVFVVVSVISYLLWVSREMRLVQDFAGGAPYT